MTNQDAKQKSAFISGEGDSWFERNAHLDIDERIENDLIIKEIDRLNIKSKKCLEIGCSEGWRLAALNKKNGFECFGIDPSKKAIEYGEDLHPQLSLVQGTADNLPYLDQSMSVVIVGFCLYLCDRTELFKIACEIDRVLSNKGILIILDFYSEQPYKNDYTHLNGIHSYKMDYMKMFTWNPIYQIISNTITDHDNNKVVVDKNERISLCSLRKSIKDSYSEKPEF
ncbi:class I SAM-dependent methyltransferase [Pseudomonas sp. HK3]|jgi:ubiquinone/menaquinone biosynthesis C-methylase UbiE